MFIVECGKCGEIKVITSIADAGGVSRAVWTCPRCGAGQVLEIAANEINGGRELREILKGLGTISKKRPSEVSKRIPMLSFFEE